MFRCVYVKLALQIWVHGLRVQGLGLEIWAVGFLRVQDPDELDQANRAYHCR